MDWRVPVESQLALSVVLFRLDQTAFERDPIDSPNKAALRFSVNIVCIGRIGKHPESVSSKNIFPAAIGDSARVLRIAYPHAVVLQPAKNVIGVGVVHAHVIELRNRQIIALPPGIAAIVGIPNAAVITDDEVIGIVGIHPNIVEIPVRSVSDSAETSAAVLAHDQGKVRLVNFVLVFRIYDQVREIKWPPYHPIAAVALFPRFAPIIGAEKRAARRLDHGVNNVWF